MQKKYLSEIQDIKAAHVKEMAQLREMYKVEREDLEKKEGMHYKFLNCKRQHHRNLEDY